MVPLNVPGDGDCLFHAIRAFYPELSVNEIRTRCVDELCLNEQFYSTAAATKGFDIVDDKSVEEHVLCILYSGVLTLAALWSVFVRPIRSIHPHVNDNDQYFEILITTLFSRTGDVQTNEEPLKIMWSDPEQEVGRD